MQAIKMETTCCQHINEAILQALNLVSPTRNVTFDFNGVKVEVTLDDTVESVLEQFDRKLDERQEAYRNSQAYKDYKAKREVEVAEKNEKLAKILNSLHEGVDDAVLVNLIGEFSIIADDSGCDKVYSENLAKFLKDLGFVSDACVGDERVATDQKVFRMWLFGQVLSGIESVGSPHPITKKFCDEYITKFYKN